MNSLRSVLVGFALCASAPLCTAQLIGYSYSSLTVETVAIGEKALREQIFNLGGTYVSAAAGASVSKQLSDLNDLIDRHVKVLVIRAFDKDLLGPVLAKAKDKGIAVVAYDRLKLPSRRCC
jgi:putative multiple sugar transport system substrate-binding protein